MKIASLGHYGTVAAKLHSIKSDVAKEIVNRKWCDIQRCGVCDNRARCFRKKISPTEVNKGLDMMTVGCTCLEMSFLGIIVLVQDSVEPITLNSIQVFQSFNL